MNETGQINDLREVSQALRVLAQQLEALSTRLAQMPAGEEGEAEVQAAREALARFRTLLGPDAAEQAAAQAQAQAAMAERLKHEVLQELLRGGPAMPMELAAALLITPSELRPIVDELEKQGLIEVQNLEEGALIRLTRRGKEALARGLL